MKDTLDHPLFEQIRDLIHSTRTLAVRAVNQAMVELYWEIGRTIVDLLEQRFPGISPLVEVIDVATPLTFERYTGNWKGSFEGWLITPENSYVMMKPMPQSLPDLKNFYMCGQWVEPGGGLPTAVMSGRRLIKKLCREDHKKFRC